MRINEFQIWLSGYCEAIGDDALPSKKQWTRIIQEVRDLGEPGALTPINIPQPVPLTPVQTGPRDLDAQTAIDLAGLSDDEAAYS
jgi:hypothetical protein